MKKHIATAVLVAITVFIVLFAYLCNPGDYYIVSPKGQKVLELTAQDITNSSDCEVINSHIKTDYSGDPYIDFSGFTLNAKCAVIKMEWTDNGSEMLLYCSDTDIPSEEQYVFVHPNAIINGNVIVALNTNEFKSIRLKQKSSFNLYGIQFYEDYELLKVPTPVSFKRYAFTAAAALFLGVAAFYIDWNFNISGKIIRAIKKRKKRVAVFCGSTALLILINIIIEALTAFVFNKNANQMFFHYNRFIIGFSIMYIIFVFCFFYKQIGTKPERPLFFIIICIGLVFIMGSPFGNCSWDVNRHYEWAHNASFYGTAFVSKADKLVYDMNWLAWPTFDEVQNHEHIVAVNEFDNMYLGVSDAKTQLPHRLSGIAIAVGRLFGFTFYQRFIIGEAAILFTYAALCFLAVRKLKSSKMIASVIALLPTNVFMASNYSYDGFVVGFLMLGSAYFISMLQDRESGLNIKDTLIMCFAFMIGCLPKLVYLLVLALPFFVRKPTFTKRDYKIYYSICSFFILLLSLLLLMRAVFSINSGGDTRGGDVNSVEQFNFILNNIPQYLKILMNFLKEYLWIGNAYLYITKFAHIGWGAFAPLFIAMLILTSLTDKSDFDSYIGNRKIKIVAIAFFLGTVCLMATAFYISFTEPGSARILGCQPRYIIPLLFPLLGVVFGSGVKQFANKRWYNMAVLTVVSAATLYNAYAATAGIYF